MKELRGAGVALVTPFKKDLSIDFEGLNNVLNHVSDSIDYLVVLGTTGESVTLTLEEKQEILDFVRENNSSKLPLVVGIGGNNTNNVIHEINTLNLKGYEAILSVSPYYNRPSQRGLLHHYHSIADNSKLPVILYNVPGRTGSNISSTTTLELANHPNIIATKEASGDLEQAMTIMRNKPDDFELISGDDLLTLPLMSIGAVGVISVLANVYPSIFRNMVKFFEEGRIKEAQDELNKFLPFNNLMYREGNPVGVKEALSQRSICQNYVRSPLFPASDELKKDIENSLY